MPDEPEDALEGHLGLLGPAREAQHQRGEHEVDAVVCVWRGVNDLDGQSVDHVSRRPPRIKI